LVSKRLTVATGRSNVPRSALDILSLRVVLPLFVAIALAVARLAAQLPEARVVRGLSFHGNHAIDSYTLGTAIATSRSSYFASAWWLRWTRLGERRYFDEVEFRRDMLRLLLLYRQSGYVNVILDTTVRRTPHDVFITVRIDEGEPVRLARLTIVGADSILSVADLKRDLPLREGDPFNRFVFQASADTLVAKAKNLGYPYAIVLRNFDEDDASLSATATLELVPGRRMRIGEVAIEGLERVDSAAVRRMLSVKPGDLFQQTRLYQSQRDLYDMGVFRSAAVVLADSTAAPSGAPGDTAARVVVRVAEGPGHRVLGGLGYGTIDCVRLQGAWTAYNFLGGARALDLTANVSKLGVGVPTDFGFQHNVCGSLDGDPTSDTLNYSVGLTLRQPTFFSPRHTARLSLYGERHSEYQTYTRQDVGVNPSVTINARRNIPVTVGYSFSVGHTTADPAIYCSVFRVCDAGDRALLASSRRLAALTVTGGRNQVNSALDPSRGGAWTAGITYATPTLGSDTLYEFTRGQFEVAHYYSLGRSAVFAWRLRAGAIVPARRIALAGQSVQFIPPDQRFYGGGPNSVRGFTLNDLGPRVYVTDSVAVTRGDTSYLDVHSSPTGGNALVVFNAELRFATPLFPERVRVAVFTDIGQVWQRGTGSPAQPLPVTPGVGLRFATPLGPVRVDAAYNGSAPEPGPLYYLNPHDNTLTLLPGVTYAPGPPSSFWRSIVVQFAVGQAF
jgi:outer membrane protein insertion porin family